VVLIWIVFLIFILALLALDLGVFHRHARSVSVREALTWTVVWIATAFAFAGFVYLGYEYHWLGLGLEPDLVERSAVYPDGRVNDARSALLKFLTGYVVELSLSVDNVFVIAMMFGYFAIPRMYQHRVLFWGILGALAMRGAMIAIGARVVAEFSWILPLFGAVLILTAVKMVFMGTEPGDPGKNIVVRMMRRFLPLTNRFDGEHFFVRAPARESLLTEPPGADAPGDGAVSTVRRAGWMLTPLAPALVMIEMTDLVFAVDSIPAIFAITADPFLVFTSNVFAILGLRSLYFALAGMLHLFRHLKHALALVLLTVGVKMLAHSWLERVLGPDFNLYMLAAVIVILGTSVFVSLIELWWHEQISRTIARTLGTLRQWIAPDHLISTIARAGQRAASRNAARHVRPHGAEHFVGRLQSMMRLWRQLFGGKVGNVWIIMVNRIFEEGEQYAMYLEQYAMYL
jgi:TerC family integral membrane protein